MYKIKNDKFKKTREGNSRVLDIRCANCGQHICYYQKDGSGRLFRLYVDRMVDIQPDGEMLRCSGCQHNLAVQMVYKKENRQAYRIFDKSVTKKMVKLDDIK